ncbi:hypothetical protein A7K94_0209115, partial [Modestobacter sp. VKM Ac-2676]
EGGNPDDGGQGEGDQPQAEEPVDAGPIEQAPAPVAVDAFDRTVDGGLGEAGLGGAWTASAGSSRQSVTPGAAELRLDGAGQNTGSFLGGVVLADADVRTAFSLSSMPTGSGTYVYVTGRRTQAGEEYRVRVRVMADGRVALALSRLSGGSEAFPGGESIVPGLTYTAGGVLHVRVQVAGVGTTEIRATAWADGQTEPATPTITRTDSSAELQVTGSVGLTVHRPGTSTERRPSGSPGSRLRRSPERWRGRFGRPSACPEGVRFTAHPL